MLVLGVKPGESVWLNVDKTTIKVEVVRMGDGSVKMGFTAPPNVEILRDSVKKRIESGEEVRKHPVQKELPLVF